MKRLIALFPGGWRRRYGHEFEALLEDGDLSPRDMLDMLRGALDARLNPQSHLGDGGHAMARPWKRGVLSATAALILLPVMVLIESWWTSSSIVRRPGGYPQTGIGLVLTPYVITMWSSLSSSARRRSHSGGWAGCGPFGPVRADCGSDG